MTRGRVALDMTRGRVALGMTRGRAPKSIIYLIYIPKKYQKCDFLP